MLRPGITSLVAAPPPPAPSADLTPAQVEFYVRSGIHHDRSPGNVLAVCHPLRDFKVPRGLFEALAQAGFPVTRVETDADRVASVERIAEALGRIAAEEGPLDVLVVSGDGSLDHHFMVAAYLAFYPELVVRRRGEIDCSAVTEEDIESIPGVYRESLLAELPDGASLDPTEERIREVWLLRDQLEGLLRKGRSVARILRKAKRPADDVPLRLAVLATFLPHKVKLRPQGFDLAGLAAAGREATFKGLYPFIRSVCTYPAGTAADNAVAAGVPGYLYGFLARPLTRFSVLGPLRRYLERRTVRAFMDFYVNRAVVVPCRLSAVALDGDWQRISSHAAGGPAAGHFFAADLTKGTKGMLGYLKRIPQVILLEGFFGTTVVRLRSVDADGRQKSFTEAHISEGVYTNRALVGGVGSVPTTDPTAFAGQSSLAVITPVFPIDEHGRRGVSLRGITGFWEGIAKGVCARILHWLHLGVGRLAGGGKFFALLPEHQVAIKEEESLEIDYLTLSKRPRAVRSQVSGDPFQCWRMQIRVITGPVPMLGERGSLLLASTRRALANLHLEQSYRLRGVYIGGVHYFRHLTGPEWDDAFTERAGLLEPPRYLPRSLVRAQERLMAAWRDAGAGDFVDTTRSGLGAFRRGRYAHNNDQSAHLLLLKEPGGTLLLREVRLVAGPEQGEIYEARVTYRPVGGSYIVHRGQTLLWSGDEPPRILRDSHFFRDAEQFQAEAPAFFPVVAWRPEEPTLLARQDYDGTGEDVEAE